MRHLYFVGVCGGWNHLSLTTASVGFHRSLFPDSVTSFVEVANEVTFTANLIRGKLSNSWFVVENKFEEHIAVSVNYLLLKSSLSQVMLEYLHLYHIFVLPLPVVGFTRWGIRLSNSICIFLHLQYGTNPTLSLHSKSHDFNNNKNS